jgi:hypothetical protein
MSTANKKVLYSGNDKLCHRKARWAISGRTCKNHTAAIAAGLIDEDPTNGIRIKIPTTGGFKMWGEPEIEQITGRSHRAFAGRADARLGGDNTIELWDVSNVNEAGK